MFRDLTVGILSLDFGESKCSTIQWKERTILSMCMIEFVLVDFLVSERSESCLSTLGF